MKNNKVLNLVMFFIVFLLGGLCMFGIVKLTFIADICVLKISFMCAKGLPIYKSCHGFPCGFLELNMG